MKSNVKLGIIGLGGIAQLMHLPILSKMDDVTLESVADPNKATLKSVAEKFGVKKVFTNYLDLLKDESIEGVIIATPTHTHKNIALDSLAAGKHIFVEKPVAPTMEDSAEIIAKAIEKNAVAMVGMNMRFRPDIMMLKSLITCGEIGDIFFVKASWLNKASSGGKWFLKKNQSGGGVIFDLGIVMLDLALWFLDYPNVKTVSTKNYYIGKSEIEDSSFSFIRCEKECLISLDVSWSLASEHDAFQLEVYGSKGSAFINPVRINKKMESGENIQFIPTKIHQKDSEYRKSFENELRHFVGAMRSLHKVASTISESLPRLQLIQSMYKSASEGAEVKVERYEEKNTFSR